MKKLLFVLSIVLALAIIIPSTVMAAVPKSSHGRQNWQLNNDSAGGGMYVMAKSPGPNAGKPASSISIASGATKIWLADQVSQGVTFPDKGAWDVELKTDSAWITSDETCPAVVGDWNGTSFTQIPARLVTFSNEAAPDKDGNPTQWAVTYEFQIGAYSIARGHYLALMVTNLDSSSHLIYTGSSEQGQSCVSSPQGDPGYPTPEVASVVLLGLGLVGLAGFGIFQYRKTRLSSSGLK